MSADDGEPEFTEQERKALSQIARERIDDWPTRRAALGAGAALLGGAGFATGRATAQADANDSDGDVGTDSNRVDLWADGITSNSIATDEVTAKGKPVHDVTAYGAVGDGTTDDTTAVQDAIDAAATDNGVVRFPHGDYYCPSGLTIDGQSDFDVKGEGEVIVRVDDTDNDPFTIASSSAVSDVTIEHLHVIGNTGAATKQTAFSIEGGATATNLTFRDCIMEDLAGDGESSLKNCTDITFENCRAINCQDDGFNPGGGSLGAGDSVTRHVTYIHCVADGCTNDGFHLSNNSQDVTVIACRSINNGRDGYRLLDQSATLRDCYANGNGGKQAWAAADIENPRILGGTYHGEIRISDGVSEPVIDGVTVVGSDMYLRGTSANPIENARVVNWTSRGASRPVWVENCPDATIAHGAAVNPSNEVINADADAAMQGPTVTDIKIEGVTDASNFIEIEANLEDTDIRGMELAANLITDNGTRTRWNGVIGGGPLGGVDLSTTTGQFEGDRALADGTSAASAYAQAVWDSAGTQWQYTDPTGTV